MMAAQHIAKVRFIADNTETSLKYGLELLESRHLFADRQQTSVRLINNSLAQLGYQIAELIRLINNEAHDHELEQKENSDVDTSTTQESA